MNKITDERFPNPLLYADYGKMSTGVDRKILLKDFSWIDPIFGEVLVKKGFLWDGASIPSFAWSILGLNPFSSEVVRAGLCHDWLYRTHLMSKDNSDKVFKRIMEYEALLPEWKINVMYLAVKWYGQSSYDEPHLESDYLRPEEVSEYVS